MKRKILLSIPLECPLAKCELDELREIISKSLYNMEQHIEPFEIDCFELR